MTKSAKTVALLPMKANSVRVTGKNFRPFAGKPLFQHILSTLLSVEEIDLVVINTDAKDILAANGLVETDRIMIRDRASDLCGDEVSMNLILADDIAAVAADTYVMTHTTNPLLAAPTIKAALTLYHDTQSKGPARSLFTVNRIQSRFYTASADPINHDPDNLIPTQDLEPWFEENSNLYIFSSETFAQTEARIGRNPIMFTMDGHESVDIDTPEDWAVAEALMLYRQRTQAGAA